MTMTPPISAAGLGRSIEIGVEAVETVRGLLATESIACDPQPEGALLVAHRPAMVAELRERARVYEDVLGYRDVEFLDLLISPFWSRCPPNSTTPA